MWEAITNILTSSNALQTIISLVVLVLIIVAMIKTGMLRIKTAHVQVGSMSKEDKERAIIREQCDWVHTYINGLEGKITMMETNQPYNGYLTKYILECIYDEVVKWITFNHMSNTESYVHAKQLKVASLVYSFNVADQFKSREFVERMHKWTKEVIEELINIRGLYNK